MSNSIDVKVRWSSGTHMARYKGRSASNTAAPELAATALGRKIFGQLQRLAVERLDKGGGYQLSVFRITPDESQKCRECGCTFSRGCAGGCSWIEPDLCSSCAQDEIL